MVVGFKVSQLSSASEARLVSVFANVLTFLGITLVDQRVGTLLKKLVASRVVEVERKLRSRVVPLVRIRRDAWLPLDRSSIVLVRII